MKTLLILVKLCFSTNFTKSKVDVRISNETHICENGNILLEATVRSGNVWADIKWLDGHLKLECKGPAVCKRLSGMDSAVTSSTTYRLYSADIKDGEMIGLRNYVKLRYGVKIRLPRIRGPGPIICITLIKDLKLSFTKQIR